MKILLDLIYFSGELKVIVEYCSFGNIHNFLLKHRSDFEDNFHENSTKSFDYEEFEFYLREPSLKGSGKKLSLMSDLRRPSMGNSYKSKELDRSVTTDDLICWAYQVINFSLKNI